VALIQDTPTESVQDLLATRDIAASFRATVVEARANPPAAGTALIILVARERHADCEIEFLRWMRVRHAHTPILFVACQGSEELAIRAFRGGATDYFQGSARPSSPSTTPFKKQLFIDVATWNTSNIDSPSTSHAEYQFWSWIESKKADPAFLASISAIEVNMKDWSPSGDCSRLLASVMRTVGEAREQACLLQPTTIWAISREHGGSYPHLPVLCRQRIPTTRSSSR
jgi:hypothetical protein